MKDNSKRENYDNVPEWSKLPKCFQTLNLTNHLKFLI